MVGEERNPRGFETVGRCDGHAHVHASCQMPGDGKDADGTGASGDGATRRRRNPAVTAALGVSMALLGLSSVMMVGTTLMASAGTNAPAASGDASAAAVTTMPTEFAPAPAIATQEPAQQDTDAGSASSEQGQQQNAPSTGDNGITASTQGDGAEDWWVDGSGRSLDEHTPLAAAKLAVRVAATASPQERIYAKGKAVADSSGDPWAEVSDPRCQEYYKLMHTVTEPYQNDGTNSNTALGSCTQAVGHVVRATVDPDFHMMGPSDVIEYCSGSPKWQRVMVMGSQKVSDVLQPGDLLCTDGHTAMYVGNELTQKAFPGSDGTVYEASYSTAMQPNISPYRTAEGYIVFRFVGNNGVKNKHPFINPWALLAGDKDYVEE